METSQQMLGARTQEPLKNRQELPFFVALPTRTPDEYGIESKRDNNKKIET
jgi:hypothetical protein